MTIKSPPTVSDGGAADALRYPCEWCKKPNKWPDACTEGSKRRKNGCTKMITKQCTSGDHRRCAETKCTFAARWHEPVRRAGMEAARAAGVAWAVVSTIENHDVSVVGTENDLGRANTDVRNVFLRRAGIPLDSDRARLLYIVRGSDGGLF